MAIRIAHIVTAVHTLRRIIFQRKRTTMQTSVALHRNVGKKVGLTRKRAPTRATGTPNTL